MDPPWFQTPRCEAESSPHEEEGEHKALSDWLHADTGFSLLLKNEKQQEQLALIVGIVCAAWVSMHCSPECLAPVMNRLRFF